MRSSIIVFMLSYVLCTGAASAATARFFSTVEPPIPTTQDSVVVRSIGVFGYGSLLDQSHSAAKTEFRFSYTIDDSLENVNNKIMLNHGLGRLPEGNYTVFTTTKSVTRSTQDTAAVTDTLRFQVMPTTKAIPEVISQRCVQGQYQESDPIPGRSYCYWNGDTLSLAMVVNKNESGLLYYLLPGYSRDTLTIHVVDTATISSPMNAGYLIVASLHPVAKGRFPVNFSYKKRSYGPVLNDDRFHRMIVDYSAPGIGFGFGNEGQRPGIVLYPDSAVSVYHLFSPFLDTVKSIVLSPNPHYKPDGRESFSVGAMWHEYGALEDWSGFDVNNWTTALSTPADTIILDTVNVSAKSMLRVSYSTAQDTVAGYVYRSLASPSPALTPDPFIRFDAFHSAGAGTSNSRFREEKGKLTEGWGMREIQIREFPSHIRLTVQTAGLRKSTASGGKIAVRFFDLRGKAIRRIESPLLHAGLPTHTLNWDKRDAMGDPVPAGIYLVSVEAGEVKHSGRVVLK